MNHNFTTEPKDTICRRCYTDDHNFLHHFWDGRKGHKMCTSCVLLSQKIFFCPTCFVVHDRFSQEKRINCNKCHSRSHVRCFPAKGSSSGAPSMCSTCIEPERLIFCLKKLKLEGENEYCKVVDMKAAELLLTAAKIVQDSLFNAHDQSEYSSVMQVTEAFMEKKNAINELKRVMKVV